MASMPTSRQARLVVLGGVLAVLIASGFRWYATRDARAEVVELFPESDPRDSHSHGHTLDTRDSLN